MCPSCGSLVGLRDDKCYTCGRSNPGLWGFGPMLRQIGADFGFAQIVVGTCVTLWVITLLMSGAAVRVGSNILSALAPAPEVLFLFGESGAIPVFGLGRWWTVLSAGWLHGGLLHIAFNVLWIRQLAPPPGEAYGPARIMILYTVAGVTGFGLSTLAGWYLGAFPIAFLRGAALTI